MKKRTFGLFLGSLILSIGAVVLISTPDKHADITFATYTNGDGATYYNGIDDSETGNTLLTSLRNLNLSKRKETVGYSAMGTTPSGQFKYTDYDPNYVKYDSNGQPYGTRISSFYTYTSATSWNREHVWPNSHGGGSGGDAGSPYPDADIHMPRPTISSENSSRGNSFFVEGMNHSSNGWDPKTAGYSEDSRGEAARITFYCTLVNSKLILAPNNTTPSGTDSVTGQKYGSGHTMGNLETLIKWNINHPVTEREKNRNEGAEYLQGNRNPFIDHPEYACKIWGNVNSTIQSMCSNATYPTVDHTVGIRIDDGYNIATSNTSAYTLKVGDSVNFLPFVDGAYNNSVSWSLDNYEYANTAYYSRGTYTNGITVTGLAQGVSNLTLSYTYDDNGQNKTIKATAVINVNESGSSGGDGGDAEDVENENTATYTVSSTSAVSTSGTVPSGSSATYSQTYSTKGQITSGKNAILTLSGYDGKVITGITLNMKSNGSSGGGSFTAVAGSTNLANTSGGFNSWYDNDSYGTSYRDVNVSLLNDTHIIGSGENITLTITGSTNSLYINSYTITYGDPSSGGDTPVPEVVTLTSIEATGMTQSYEVGDTFSFDGALIATYSDGDTDSVNPTTVSSPDMSTTGNKTVTITYTEDGITKSTSYTIYVAEKQLALLSLTLSGQKTSYYVGDTFAFTGKCTANYEENVSKEVTPSSVSSPNMSTAGNKTITVTYTENEVTKTASYTINVQAVVLESITLGGLTTEYYVGDNFVKPSVTATYNNHTELVTDQASFTGYDLSTAGEYEVTVSFGGLTQKYDITVSEKPIDPTPTGGDYVKVTSTSDIEDGNYLIVYEEGSKAFDGSLTTLDATKNTIDVVISNNKIASSDVVDASAFTIGSSAGSIRSASGYYIGTTSNSNTINSSQTTVYENTLTINDGNFVALSSGGAYLRYNSNSDQARFRYFKSSSYTNQKAIQLYKQTGGITPSEKILESISISNATTSFVQGSTFVKPTVTAHYDNGSSAVVTTASFAGYNLQELGEQTVTAYYTESGVTVTATYTINVVMNTTVTTPLYKFYDGSITLKTSRGDLTSDDWYDIEGVIVGINGYQYCIQQGEYGILVFNEIDKNNNEYLYTYYNGISIGDHVIIHARVYSYGGLIETNSRDSDQTVAKVGVSPLPDAIEFDNVSSFMSYRPSVRASLSNIEFDQTNLDKIDDLSESTTEDIKLTARDVNNINNTVTIFIHRSIPNIPSIVTKLKTITSENTIEFVRCYISYYNGNQISLSSADQIVIHSPSEDKLAAWGVNLLFIGDPAFDGDGIGACKTSNFYKDAKSALLALEEEESGIITLLQEDYTYHEELDRYLAWATACGDDSPFIDDFTFMNNSLVNNFFNIDNGNTILVTIIISSIFISTILGMVIIKKKRK